MIAENDRTPTSDVCNWAIEDQLGAPRFWVRCPECDRSYTVHINAMLIAALLNQYGQKAVDRRFDALNTQPRDLTCPLCLFQSDDREAVA